MPSSCLAQASNQLSKAMIVKPWLLQSPAREEDCVLLATRDILQAPSAGMLRLEAGGIAGGGGRGSSPQTSGVTQSSSLPSRTCTGVAPWLPSNKLTLCVLDRTSLSLSVARFWHGCCRPSVRPSVSSSLSLSQSFPFPSQIENLKNP